jgi:CheY-like chemotaxis protein
MAILIVDDDPLVRMCAAEELSDFGYKVFEAANADEAIRILEEHSEIRLIFTDVNMPGLDGVKLAHAIAKRWPPVKIVVTSALPLRDELPAGARFVGKPYLSKDVHRTFQSMLS